MKKKERIKIMFDGDIFGFWEAVYLFYSLEGCEKYEFFYLTDKYLSTLTTNPYKNWISETTKIND